MTINEKVKMFLKRIVTSMTKAMQAANTERQLVLVYLCTLDVLGTICGSKIPDQSEVDELAFIKLNEQTADEIWDILKQNLERLGSDLIHDSRFDLLNPANGLRDENVEAKVVFLIPPAKMVQ